MHVSNKHVPPNVIQVMYSIHLSLNSIDYNHAPTGVTSLQGMRKACIKTGRINFPRMSDLLAVFKHTPKTYFFLKYLT